MIQRGGTQIRGDSPDRRDPDLDEADERLQAIDDHRSELLFVDFGAGAAELELDGGQRLAELVVELARQRGALLLTRRLYARREPAHLFLGLLQVGPGFDRLGDVAADAFDSNHQIPRERSVCLNAGRPMREHPPVLSVRVTRAVLERERSAGPDAPPPSLGEQIVIGWVYAGEPPTAQFLTEGAAGEIKPPAIDEGETTLWVGDPEHHRRVIQSRAKGGLGSSSSRWRHPVGSRSIRGELAHDHFSCP